MSNVKREHYRSTPSIHRVGMRAVATHNNRSLHVSTMSTCQNITSRHIVYEAAIEMLPLLVLLTSTNYRNYVYFRLHLVNGMHDRSGLHHAIKLSLHYLLIAIPQNPWFAWNAPFSHRWSQPLWTWHLFLAVYSFCWCCSIHALPEIDTYRGGIARASLDYNLSFCEDIYVNAEEIIHVC